MSHPHEPNYEHPPLEDLIEEGRKQAIAMLERIVSGTKNNCEMSDALVTLQVMCTHALGTMIFNAMDQQGMTKAEAIAKVVISMEKELSHVQLNYHAGNTRDYGPSSAGVQ